MPARPPSKGPSRPTVKSSGIVKPAERTIRVSADRLAKLKLLEALRKAFSTRIDDVGETADRFKMLDFS